MKIIKYRKIFFGISAVLVGVSLLSLIFFGLNFGIEFTGGSILEVSYEENTPEFSEVEARISDLNMGTFTLQAVGDEGYILRTRFLTEEERISVAEAMSFDGASANEERFNSIGPVIGSELKNKALIALASVVVAIILFIAYVFRKVSKPVSSWKYGLTAVLALLHDIIIPVGLFAILGVLIGTEVDLLFVTALLAILGFSVNDTIVVFDRVRENLRTNQEKGIKEEFEETVGKSLSQSYARAINTSLTTALVLGALYFVGGEVTRNFSLVLLVGVIVGTYSSICLASPLLVAFEKIQRK